MAGGPVGGGDEQLVDINITPLVDVVLVLLIIFMLMAPAMFATEIPLELPTAATSEPTAGQDIGIVILADGGLLVDGEPVTRDGLRALAAAAGPQARALISADTATRHGVVVEVLDLLRTAGIEKYAINVVPDKDGGNAPAAAGAGDAQ